MISLKNYHFFFSDKGAPFFLEKGEMSEIEELKQEKDVIVSKEKISVHTTLSLIRTEIQAKVPAFWQGSLQRALDACDSHIGRVDGLHRKIETLRICLDRILALEPMWTQLEEQFNSIKTAYGDIPKDTPNTETLRVQIGTLLRKFPSESSETALKGSLQKMRDALDRLVAKHKKHLEKKRPRAAEEEEETREQRQVRIRQAALGVLERAKEKDEIEKESKRIKKQIWEEGRPQREKEKRIREEARALATIQLEKRREIEEKAREEERIQEQMRTRKEIELQRKARIEKETHILEERKRKALIAQRERDASKVVCCPQYLSVLRRVYEETREQNDVVDECFADPIGNLSRLESSIVNARIKQNNEYTEQVRTISGLREYAAKEECAFQARKRKKMIEAIESSCGSVTPFSLPKIDESGLEPIMGGQEVAIIWDAPSVDISAVEKNALRRHVRRYKMAIEMIQARKLEIVFADKCYLEIYDEACSAFDENRNINLAPMLFYFEVIRYVVSLISNGAKNNSITRRL